MTENEFARLPVDLQRKDTDMVRVVRCKDCKHYRKEGNCSYFGYYTYMPDVEEDDFCSYGERDEADVKQ